MTKMSRSLPFLGAALLATSLPALAETFTVTLKNGNAFKTRYRPQPAALDQDTVLMLTEWGNRIALAKEDIQEIRSETPAGRFGQTLDTGVEVIGAAPNDAPLAGAGLEAERDYLTLVFHYLDRGPVPRPQVMSVRQFAEPPVAGEGATFPVWNLINLDLMPRRTPPATPQFAEPPVRGEDAASRPFPLWNVDSPYLMPRTTPPATP